MNGFRKEFTTFSIVLMAVAIATNIALGWLVIQLKLPLYLDSIGTVLVGVLVGPWAGALTGLLANVVWTLSGLFPQAIAWSLVAAVIGFMAGLFGRRIKRMELEWPKAEGVWLAFFVALAFIGIVAAFFGFSQPLQGRIEWTQFFLVEVLVLITGGYVLLERHKNSLQVMSVAGLAGLATGLVAAVLSAPIAALVFGGVTGTGMDAVVALFRSAGLDVLSANFAQGLAVEPIDKTVTYIIVWAIFLNLPLRLRNRFADTPARKPARRR